MSVGRFAAFKRSAKEMHDRRSEVSDRRRRFQFGLRSLLLAAVVFAVALAICTRWPVKEIVPQTANVNGVQITFHREIERLPTIPEWLIRVAIVAAAILTILIVAVALRELARRRSLKHNPKGVAYQSPGSR